MKPLEVRDFNGGMRDEVDSVQPRFSKRLRNLLLDSNGKPYQRNGQAIWSTAQIPTGERVSGIKIFRDPRGGNAFQNYTAAVYSHRKLWIPSNSYTGPGISESVGPTGWTEILNAPDPLAQFSQLSIAPNVSQSTKVKFQRVNQLLYASFSNRDAYTANNGNLHPRPKRIYQASDSYPNFLQASVGCPDYNFATPTFTPQNAGVAHSYVYWLCYVLTFTDPTTGTSYEYRGAPGGPYTVTTGVPIDAAGGHGVTIGNIYRPYGSGNSNNDPVDFSTVALEIYRTTDAGTVPKLAQTFTFSGTGFGLSTTDTTTDATLGQNLYTADGTASFDYPPPCKIYHVVNASVGYFGGFDIFTNGSGAPFGYQGAIQSSPGVPESAPSAFLIPAPDHLTGIESIDIYPIFATRSSIWRVEGTIDAFGNGNVNLRPISERVGCIRPNAMVKTDQGLIFAADDGLYYTDGFQATKVTDHLNKYYRSWFNGFSDSALDDIAAIYHPPTKRYFYSSLQADAPSYASMPNTLHAGDLRHRTDEGGAAHSYLQGEANQTTNGLSFIPTALESFRDHLFVGDGQGYITKIKVEPSDPAGADIVTSDVGVDGSVAQASWKQYPIVWDYISPIFDFGSRAIKKWVTRLLITFKIRKNPAPSIYVQPYAINDGAYTSDSANEARALTVIHQTAVPANRREWTETRRMPKGGIRCNTQQIRIMKAQGILYASSTFGHGLATINAGAFTATLQSGSWPDVIGQYLQLADSGYAANFLITAVSGGVLTVSDPGSGLPSPGPWAWQIFGYPKDQAGGLESYVIGYTELAPGMQTITPANPTGGN